MTTSIHISFRDQTRSPLTIKSNRTVEEINRSISLAFAGGDPIMIFTDINGNSVIVQTYEIHNVKVTVSSGRSKWVQNLNDMHAKFGFHDKIKGMDDVKLQKFLKFRIDFLSEELTEMYDAYYEGNPEEIVDALIDLCVVAIGTLDAFEIDAEKAWDEVQKANMSKVAGVKPNRPNPLGLPDLMKPEGWVGPSHEGNHGLLSKAFEDSTPEEDN